MTAAARLAEAQSNEIRALADYQIAQVDLAFSTGTLLGAAMVEWAPAGKPDTDYEPEEVLPRTAVTGRPDGPSGMTPVQAPETPPEPTPPHKPAEKPADAPAETPAAEPPSSNGAD